LFYLNQEDDKIGQIMLNQILLEIAPRTTDTVKLKQLNEEILPQNKLQFSISPYLAPEENLSDFIATGPGSLEKNKSVKRLPQPIMYSIDPMPQKIKIESIQSDARDQALLGDPYDIRLKLSVLEDIKMTSLQATFKSFTTAPLFDGSEEAGLDRLTERSFGDVAAQEGMMDIDLTQ